VTRQRLWFLVICFVCSLVCCIHCGYPVFLSTFAIFIFIIYILVSQLFVVTEELLFAFFYLFLGYCPRFLPVFHQIYALQPYKICTVKFIFGRKGSQHYAYVAVKYFRILHSICSCTVCGMQIMLCV